MREGVGIIEISGFAKYMVSGPSAEAWLDRMLACRIPALGRMTLAPMLKPDGRLIGDFSLARLGPEEFLVAGSGIAEDYHVRWFEAHLPDRGVSFTVKRGEMTGLSIAGPRSRDLLQSITDADVSAEAFRFMDIQRMDVAMAPALVGRVSFTGDLGYEIWVSAEYQRYVYDVLKEAGSQFGIKDFGLRALNAMRLEKGFGGWAGNTGRSTRRMRLALGALWLLARKWISLARPRRRSIGKTEESFGFASLRLMRWMRTQLATSRSGKEAKWSDGSPLEDMRIIPKSRWRLAMYRRSRPRSRPVGRSRYSVNCWMLVCNLDLCSTPTACECDHKRDSREVPSTSQASVSTLGCGWTSNSELLH